MYIYTIQLAFALCVCTSVSIELESLASFIAPFSNKHQTINMKYPNAKSLYIYIFIEHNTSFILPTSLAFNYTYKHICIQTYIRKRNEIYFYICY